MGIWVTASPASVQGSWLQQTLGNKTGSIKLIMDE